MELTEEVGIGQTESLCPVCLKKIKAEKIRCGKDVYLRKTCPEHGTYQVRIWGSDLDYEAWYTAKERCYPKNPATEVEKGCPYDCGLCREHRQKTCCVLLEVTKRCGLQCPICFASAGEDTSQDPSLEQIGRWYDKLMEQGGPFNIQLSGGEPAQRDDLPKIICLGREKGFTFFQLNTNGLRLAREPEFALKLKEAGLNCVFLQFDGVTDSVYEALRGQKLLEKKKQAIENCGRAGLGVVLVPVVAKGVNDQELGEILDFALRQMPVVRGVHFQPLSYFGRYAHQEDWGRITLDELLCSIEEQTKGRMKAKDFAPGGAENSYCSFSGNFMEMEDGSIRPWRDEGSCGCGSSKESTADASRQSREFVARRWSAADVLEEEESCCCCCGSEESSLEEGCCHSNESSLEECCVEECCCSEESDSAEIPSLDQFLERLETHSLAVSAMGFMDVWNLDLDRLRDCYIHVVTGDEDIRLIPFCAYNLTAENGTPLYRGFNE